MLRRIVLLALGGALGACSSATPLPPRALELNRLGAEALDQGDLASAEARLALALEFHPRFVEAQVNLGLVELSRGNHERARALFLRARNLNENLPHPHHGLGVLAHRQLRLHDADAHYRQALKIDPAFLPSRANLGRLLFDAGSLDEARVQFARLAEAAPADGRGHGGLVETLLRLGRREDAHRALLRGLQLAPRSPQVRLLQARQALDEGAIEDARNELLRLTSEAHDALPSAHAWLALAELARGDLDAAQRQAARALDLDQHEPVATYAMAQILEARGAPEADAWRRRVEQGRPGVATGPWTRLRLRTAAAATAAAADCGLRERGGWLRGAGSARLGAVQGQLPRRLLPSTLPLDAFLEASLPGPSSPSLRRLGWAYLGVQGVLMLVVRLADGGEAYLEGAVARGWSIFLLLQAIPAAVALARGGGGVVDEGAWTLVDLQGIPREVFLARARLAPLRAQLRVFLPALLALGAWPAALLLGTPPAQLGLRLLVVLLLALAGLLGAAALLALGAAVGRWLPPARAPWALLVFVLGPWLLASLADLPDHASAPGLFHALTRGILGLS